MVAGASAAARAEAARAEAQATPAKRAGEASKRAAERKRPAPRLASMAEQAQPAVLARSPLGAQRSALLSSTRIQLAMAISQPGDAAEIEADRIAAQIVAMPEPGARPAVSGGAIGVQRSPLVVQRAPAGPADNVADPATEEAVKKELSGGAPMAPDVAGFFGRRFKADFSGVRIHTDGKAQNLSTRLGARAFTYGRHVFFNAGQYNPDSAEGAKLIAHELTHTIQQQAAIQLKEAEAPRVANRTERRAQRGIVSRALNWIADKANYIPGFRLFTIVIGVNPINMSKVERSGANILRALIEFIPGGGLIVDALNNHGIFEKGGKFIEDQFRSLGMVGSAFRDALMEFIDSLGWSDIFHLGDVWDRAKRIFTAPVDRLIAFGKGLVTGIATIVKDAILKPLGRYAARVVPKWDLLVGVFGKNPVSDEGQGPAATLIGAFMELIGQKEVWDNIQKGGAVAKAWAWFKSVLSEAFAMVKSIPGQFVATLKSLTIMDIVTIVGAWVKFAKLFGGFVVQFISWAGGKVLRLLEIILEVVAPSVIPYLKKAGGAFRTIIRAPGRFIGNLVRAGKAGFNQFKANIVAHLKRGIFDWLLGSIAEANIYIPRSFDLKEILKFGLSVVGLTWANIRAKLVAATNETVVVALETGFELVRTLVTQGPMAAWQQFLEHLSNLKQMAMDAIIDFIRGEVIRVAIEKVVSMFIPAAAFIQALLSIYRTVMFVVNEIRRIAAVVAAIIDGISAIANGVIGAAAGRVENILARGLSLAISFLANFAGLGNVSRKVVDIVKKIRAPVDKALDKVVSWIVAQARRLGKMAKDGVHAMIDWWKEKKPFRNKDGESHTLQFIGTGDTAKMGIATTLMTVRAYLDSHADKGKPVWNTANSVYDTSMKVIYSPALKTQPEKDRRARIASELAKVSAAFANLSGAPPEASDYPTSKKPTYGNPAQVEFIVGTPLAGSITGAWPTKKPGYKEIYDAGLTTATDRWVQMHIISEKLGGSGTDFENLVPAPNSVNTGPFRSFEHAILPLAKATSGKIKNVVWVEVTIAGTKTAATGISGKAGLYFWMGKAASPKWKKSDVASFRSSAGIPVPQTVAAKKRKMYLNFTSGTEMQRDFSIVKATSDLIKQGRPYATIDDFKQKMLAQGLSMTAIMRIVVNKDVALNGP